MFHLSRESRRAADKAGLLKGYGLTRHCPHCGRELLWEQDQAGLMDYDSDPHKPHVLSCPEIPFEA
jgi:hypothetical protein